MSIFSEEDQESIRGLVKRFSIARKSIKEKNEQLQKLAKEIEEDNTKLLKIREDEFALVDKYRQHHSLEVINEEISKILK